jgi:hypothetical protein
MPRPKRAMMLRHSASPVLAAALSMAVLCVSVPVLAADKTAGPVRFEVGVDEKYDDVAIYVVDQAAGRTYTDWDWITEPYLTISYTRPGRLPTKLLFDFTADIYAKHSIQDYETFRFLVRQYVDDRTDVTVKYTFIPYIFFGDDVTQAAPGSTVPTREQSHQIHIVQVAADHEATTDLTLSASAKFGVRIAQPAFTYRDFTLWGGSLEGAYRLSPSAKLVLGTSYEWDEARGGTNAFTSSPDEATYGQLSFYSSLSYLVAEAWLLKGRYAYRWRDYPTGNAGDTLHHGRTDHVNVLAVETIYQIARPLYLHVGYDSVWRDSTKSYAQYHENIYTIGADYRF